MELEDGVVGESPVIRISTSEVDDLEAVGAAAREAAADVHVAAVGPTGADDLDPLVLATAEGRTAYHAGCSPERAADLVASLESGDLPTDDALAVVDHEPGTETLPEPDPVGDAATAPAESIGPLAAGRRRVLARAGWAAPTSVADAGELVVHQAREDPESIREPAATLGLRGRGRGDARTDEQVVEAWDEARESEGDAVVVVNANEADPAIDGDSLLLGGLPIDVLDGALSVAAVVDATDVVVYVNETDRLAQGRAQAAVDALGNAGVLGSDADVNVQVAVGPDQYTAGEMTMALESLEGNDRLEARLRPPTPSAYGLYGRPTVIHTPRTFAQIRAAIRRPGWFDADDSDPGTRLVTVSAGGATDTGSDAAPDAGADGHATRATVELPTGGALSTAADALGVDDYKLAVVGGQFGGLARNLDVPPSAGALAGATLGSNGAVELFDDDQCAVSLVGTRAAFAREENCGRCVPCREGSKQLLKSLRDIYDHDYGPGKLSELSRVMRTSSTCDFGQEAARPVQTAMEQFETEFRAHADGRCPAGTCDGGNR